MKLLRNSTENLKCRDTYLALFDMFDKAGVPPNASWRSVLLFFREIKDNNQISDAQKIAIQHLLTSVLSEKDYSDKRLDSLLREYQKIIVNPYQCQIESLVHEVESIISGFQAILSTRYGDIGSLEEQTVSIISDFENNDCAINRLRNAFAKVKNLFDSDICQLKEMATLDSVTKIANRRTLDTFIVKAIEQWQSASRPLAFSLLDIDHFKRFNDEHGHRIGDQVLSVVGAHLKKLIAELSATNEVLAARYGGEEFALVVSGPDAPNITSLVKKCCDAIRNFNFLIRDTEGSVVESGLHITVSGGVVIASPQWKGAYFANLIDSADKALYHAKKSGRDAVIEFRPTEKDPFVRVE